jgi:hypothetical protein
MTDARILFPEFRDEQSDSKYPFADYVTLTANDGISIIAGDTFIDATFFPIGGGRRLHITAITIGVQAISITVGDTNTPALITATYNPAMPPIDGVLQFFDVYDRPAGMLLSNPLSLGRFSTWTTNVYTFEPTATEFVASVSIPANEPGVRGVLSPTGALLAGDIWLLGDAGIVIRREQNTESVIRVDVVGVPLFKRFVCEPLDDFPAKNYLQTINGCGPDAYGNFTITATGEGVLARTRAARPDHPQEWKDDTVLRVYPQNGTIVFDAVGRSAT